MAENLKIAQDHVVSIDYVLTDDDGATIDSSEGSEPLTYLHGHSQIIPGLENALAGKEEGHQQTLKIPPEEGYGEHDPEKIFKEPRGSFDFEVEAGQILQAKTPDGHTLAFQVMEVGPEEVTLDGNHPLAGKNLNFVVTVREVREATEEELSHGHAHTPGHHH
jgi:FKBP-type peptidyl-prolyl cis-trans isomerase SlyD